MLLNQKRKRETKKNKNNHNQKKNKSNTHFESKEENKENVTLVQPITVNVKKEIKKEEKSKKNLEKSAAKFELAQNKTFLGLPSEIGLLILSYFTPKELAIFALVCKFFKQLCDSDELWSKLISDNRFFFSLNRTDIYFLRNRQMKQNEDCWNEKEKSAKKEKESDKVEKESEDEEKYFQQKELYKRLLEKSQIFSELESLDKSNNGRFNMGAFFFPRKMLVMLAESVFFKKICNWQLLIEDLDYRNLYIENIASFSRSHLHFNFDNFYQPGNDSSNALTGTNMVWAIKSNFEIFQAMSITSQDAFIFFLTSEELAPVVVSNIVLLTIIINDLHCEPENWDFIMDLIHLEVPVLKDINFEILLNSFFERLQEGLKNDSEEDLVKTIWQKVISSKRIKEISQMQEQRETVNDAVGQRSILGVNEDEKEYLCGENEEDEKRVTISDEDMEYDDESVTTSDDDREEEDERVETSEEMTDTDKEEGDESFIERKEEDKENFKPASMYYSSLTARHAAHFRPLTSDLNTISLSCTQTNSSPLSILTP
jgi:hypothetical protein